MAGSLFQLLYLHGTLGLVTVSCLAEGLMDLSAHPPAPSVGGCLFVCDLAPRRGSILECSRLAGEMGAAWSLAWQMELEATSPARPPSLLPSFKDSIQVKGGHFNYHLPHLEKWQHGLPLANRIDFSLMKRLSVGYGACLILACFQTGNEMLGRLLTF